MGGGETLWEGTQRQASCGQSLLRGLAVGSLLGQKELCWPCFHALVGLRQTRCTWAAGGFKWGGPSGSEFRMGTWLPAATSCWGYHFLWPCPRWDAPQQGRARPVPPPHLSPSLLALFGTPPFFGFFRDLQKETFWEVLTPFSEPREMIWPGPGEPVLPE